MERSLIARGDGLDEPDPVRFGYGSLRPVDVEHIAEDSLRAIIVVPAWWAGRIHSGTSWSALAGLVKPRWPDPAGVGWSEGIAPAPPSVP